MSAANKDSDSDSDSYGWRRDGGRPGVTRRVINKIWHGWAGIGGGMVWRDEKKKKER